jgi:hypothetical protein
MTNKKFHQNPTFTFRLKGQQQQLEAILEIRDSIIQQALGKGSTKQHTRLNNFNANEANILTSIPIVYDSANVRAAEILLDEEFAKLEKNESNQLKYLQFLRATE